MIDCLPPELVLQVLAYLPLPTISVLTIVAKSWNFFIADYQTTVFRQAAFLHGYIDDPKTSINSPDIHQRYSRRITEDLAGWKALCRRRRMVQRAWTGDASSTLKSIPTTFSTPPSFVHAVHRIKVDEGRGLIMTTSQAGGLFVMDMDTGKALWMLFPSYVAPYAHLEYSNGFLIFNREDGNKEIWKLLPAQPTQVDEPLPTLDPASEPDSDQESNNDIGIFEARKLQLGPNSDPTASAALLRGCFEPYALLRMPEITTAFRFVYPTLAITAHDKVYFWDVPSARLTEVVVGVQMITPEEHQVLPPVPIALGNHRYVDHGAEHVFLAGSFVIKVLQRSSGERKAKCILQVPSSQWRYGRWKYCIEPGTDEKAQDCALVRHKLHVTEEEQQIKVLSDQFIAVHVSPCRSHFAALLMGSRLVIVPHFQRLAQSPQLLYDNILDIQLSSPKSSMARYLAYEQGDAGEGRIGVVTTSAVFIITVPYLSLPSTTEPARPPPPQIRICHIQNLMNPSYLAPVSCLMLSDTGLFVNYDPSSMAPCPMSPRNGERDEEESGEAEETDMEDTDGEAGELSEDEMNEMDEMEEMGVEVPFNLGHYDRVEEARADVDQDQLETAFEDGLKECRENIEGCYRRTSAGDLMVMPRIRRNQTPEVSIVFGVNMLP